jgi:hypothetical protein
MSRWFRFYDDVLNDLKVQSLPGELFKAWVNLMCLTSKKDGEAFAVDDVVFSLRITQAKAQAIIDELLKRELLDDTETGVVSHNWNARQFKSDTSNDRVKRFRRRHSNGECNVTVTPPETEQIQNRTEQKEKRAAGAALPPDWKPSNEDYEYGIGLGLTLPQINSDFEEMRLWAQGNSNRAVARKADWHATFRGWMKRNSKDGTNGKSQSLTAAARRQAAQGISFGPKPGAIRSEPDSNVVRLLPEGGGE